MIFSRFPSSRGKHLVQALPPVFTLQCLTGKADKTTRSAHRGTYCVHSRPILPICVCATILIATAELIIRR